MITLEDITALPRTHREIIPPEYEDEMGHMNISHYVGIYSKAAWGLFNWIGITWDYLRPRQGGMFALKQYIHYIAEVHVGHTVVVHSRVLGVSERRLHYIHFMINETTNNLASTFEVLASYADLSIRRTAPFPNELRIAIDATLEQHERLPWQAPLCGILKA